MIAASMQAGARGLPSARRAHPQISPKSSASPRSPSPMAMQPGTLRQAWADHAISLGRWTLAASAAAVLLLSPAQPAAANSRIAEFSTNGLVPVPGVFQDTLQVYEFQDPQLPTVTLYYTDYSRSLSKKLFSDPFSDPSQSSITCVASAPVVITEPAKFRSGDGIEVFSERKTLNLLSNKAIRVRRVYDEARGAIVYVVYSTRNFDDTTSSSRYKTSICALPVTTQQE